jgi:hypothetical protein
MTVAAGETTWGRTPVIDCYCRVVTDESRAGATVEYHIVAIDAAGNLTWDSGLPLNTSDYQEQSTSQDAGKILVGGTTPGTYGANLDPNSFGAGIAAGAVGTAKAYTDDLIVYRPQVFHCSTTIGARDTDQIINLSQVYRPDGNASSIVKEDTYESLLYDNFGNWAWIDGAKSAALPATQVSITPRGVADGRVDGFKRIFSLNPAIRLSTTFTGSTVVNRSDLYLYQTVSAIPAGTDLRYSLVYDRYGVVASFSSEDTTAGTVVLVTRSIPEKYTPPRGSDAVLLRINGTLFNKAVNGFTYSVPTTDIQYLTSNLRSTGRVPWADIKQFMLIVDNDGTVASVDYPGETLTMYTVASNLAYTPPVYSNAPVLTILGTAYIMPTNKNGTIDVPWGQMASLYSNYPFTYAEWVALPVDIQVRCLVFDSQGTVARTTITGTDETKLRLTTVGGYTPVVGNVPMYELRNTLLPPGTATIRIPWGQDLYTSSGVLLTFSTVTANAYVFDRNGSIGRLRGKAVGGTETNEVEASINTVGYVAPSAATPAMPKALFSRTDLNGAIGGTTTVSLANFRIFQTNGAAATVADIFPGSQFVYDDANHAGFVETFTASSASNGSAVVRTMNSGGLLNL